MRFALQVVVVGDCRERSPPVEGGGERGLQVGSYHRFSLI